MLILLRPQPLLTWARCLPCRTKQYISILLLPVGDGFLSGAATRHSFLLHCCVPIHNVSFCLPLISFCSSSVPNSFACLTRSLCYPILYSVSVVYSVHCVYLTNLPPHSLSGIAFAIINNNNTHNEDRFYPCPCGCRIGHGTLPTLLTMPRICSADFRAPFLSRASTTSRASAAPILPTTSVTRSNPAASLGAMCLLAPQTLTSVASASQASLARTAMASVSLVAALLPVPRR